MSLGQEYKAEYDANDIYMIRKAEAERGVWTTKDGQRIHIQDMTDSHIRNTLNMLIRNNDFDINAAWIEVLSKELNRREAGGDDLVHVVRCGQCKFFQSSGCFIGIQGAQVSSDNYCAWGQRKHG